MVFKVWQHWALSFFPSNPNVVKLISLSSVSSTVIQKWPKTLHVIIWSLLLSLSSSPYFWYQLLHVPSEKHPVPLTIPVTQVGLSPASTPLNHRSDVIQVWPVPQVRVIHSAVVIHSTLVLWVLPLGWQKFPFSSVVGRELQRPLLVDIVPEGLTHKENYLETKLTWRKTQKKVLNPLAPRSSPTWLNTLGLFNYVTQ